MKQAYLKSNHPELRIIWGLGEFAAHLPALPVPDAIADEFSTEEARAAGWVVTRIEQDHGAYVEGRGQIAAPADDGE